MTAVFIGAGADNCGLNEFEFTYHLLNNDKQHDVCTDLIAKMEKKSNNSNHSSHGVDHLTGQLCELALEQNNDNDNDKSTASTSHMERPLMSTNTAWRIAPCRRPRAHASSSSLRSLTTPMPVSSDRPVVPAVVSRSSAMMSLSFQDIRRQRAVSAPTPISPNNERSAFINHDKQPHQDTSPSHCNEPVSNLQRKRRLSLDVEVPASVLKRRGAISPLVVPSLECFIRQTRARLDAQATTTTTPSPLIGSPVLSMADDTSCPSTDDEFDHEDLVVADTPWAL